MPADGPTWVTDIDATEERENRVRLALLRGVVENLKANRVVVPVFGIAIAAMFPQWVDIRFLAAWYFQMLLGFIPQVVALAKFPDAIMTSAEVKTWSRRIAIANLIFVANWSSLGAWFWARGYNSNHLVVELILAASLAAHAATTGTCRSISRPALLLYLLVMTAVPLQGLANPATFTRSLVMLLLAPVYVGFMGFIAHRNYTRARKAVLLAQERDSLLAE